MCGIIVALDGEHCAHDRHTFLDRMRRLRHRGPDSNGVSDLPDGVLMGHERLAIVGIDFGSQPMRSRDGNVVLAINGEIYNYQDLRTSVATGVLRSDSEVIIEMYEAGAEPDDLSRLLNQLNGIFAFVLYDLAKSRYIIARDHCGIVPLYWGRDDLNRHWVASEMKAIHDICPNDLDDFPPGHIYDSSNSTLTEWYVPGWKTGSPVPRAPGGTIRSMLEAAVHRQLMADVPFGVLLSGGLDSSIIASIASQWVRPPRLLHSFSIGLEGSPDLAAAYDIAEILGTTHHEFIFTVQEGLDAYRDVIYQLETYDVTTIRAATPMYLLARKIRALGLGIKMVLSGEGADEVFGGYLYFHMCPSKEEMQAELIRKVTALHKFDCLRANKAMMSFGIEARVPFLDREFLDYAMSIPPEEKMCGGTSGKMEKQILRDAFHLRLPDQIRLRQKEQFSDGVGYAWIDEIQNEAARHVSLEAMVARAHRFPVNTPATKEAYLAREIFAEYYPSDASLRCVPGGPSIACSSAAAVKWDRSFQHFADCSGRAVAGVHQQAYRRN